MKSIVIFFSLTGNTRKVAEAIRRGVARVAGECSITTLRELNAGQLRSTELLAIGSPVWGQVPPNVSRAIKNMPLLPGRHAFAFCTHGTRPGQFFPVATELLRERGLTVLGIRGWYGAVHIPTLPKPYPTDGHPDNVDLADAEAFGSEMALLSQGVIAGTQPVPVLPKFPKLRASRLSRPLPRRDAGKCGFPGCSLCMDHCPMGAIDLKSDPPVFGRGCAKCYFCELICPTGAVEVEYEALATANIRRARRVYEKSLDQAEAEGRFRRLIPREKISWSTPLYKAIPTHPRYRIPEE